MCDTSGPNTGSIISLNAIGKQDTYLLEDDPIHSLFKYEPKDMPILQSFKNLNINKPSSGSTSWPFGETIKVTYNPRNMGDLLANMYVTFELPRLTGTDSYYTDQIGRHIFKSVTMRVDETVVEKYHGDWGIIYDELYLDESEKRTKRYTLNRNNAEDTSLLAGNQVLAQAKSRVYIPIPLLFHVSMKVMNMKQINQIVLIFQYMLSINKNFNLNLNFINKHFLQMKQIH